MLAPRPPAINFASSSTALRLSRQLCSLTLPGLSATHFATNERNHFITRIIERLPPLPPRSYRKRFEKNHKELVSCYNWLWKKFFWRFLMSTRSIVDEVDEKKDNKELSLEDVGDMLFLVFSAVKDLEAKIDEHIASGRSSS
jgi:hypothetical protein